MGASQGLTRVVAMFMLKLASLLCVFLTTSLYSAVHWVNPLRQEGWKVEGRIWDQGNYARLPERAKATVRPAVWGLGQQSAGLCVRFWTNASEIHLDYQLAGNLSMPHMPATGVSGFDLYRRSREAGRYWVACTKPTSHKSQVKLVSGMAVDARVPQLYTLYLPLYSSVDNLRIGVPEGKTLLPARADALKPIVVYGTSIAQGACASRPGMAWTNILGRKLDWPIVNLGFSGNGRMELEVIDLLVEKEAAMFIIDCLPNLNAEQVKQRIGPVIDRIRESHPQTPILLVEEAPRSNARWLPAQQKSLKAEWAALRSEFDRRKTSDSKLFYLKGENLMGSDGEATVDAVHPNDLGMMRYATAYEPVVRGILAAESVRSKAGVPAVSQLREIPGYNFMERHQKILQRHQQVKPDVVWLGDSIVHFFAGEPKAVYVRGQQAWDALFKGQVVTNLAYGWDRTENVLWRVQRGELDSIKPKRILLSIGTNDLPVGRSVEQIVGSIHGLVVECKRRQPQAEILVTGIIPRKGYAEQRAAINQILAQQAADKGYRYLDLSPAFPVNTESGLIQGLSPDQLHPNTVGYTAMAALLKKELGE